jgi:hypothetical protein
MALGMADGLSGQQKKALCTGGVAGAVAFTGLNKTLMNVRRRRGGVRRIPASAVLVTRFT